MLAHTHMHTHVQSDGWVQFLLLSQIHNISALVCECVLLFAVLEHFCLWMHRNIIETVHRLVCEGGPDSYRGCEACVFCVICFQANLLQLIKLRPSLLHLGDQGVTLLSRFLSVPTGFRSLRDANFIPSELERWHKACCD